MLFAAVTALNMDLLQSNKARDVSLENMISTANANSEVSNGCLYCEVSNGCLYCGGDGVRSGGSTCTYCSAGNRNVLVQHMKTTEEVAAVLEKATAPQEVVAIRK